MYSPSPQIMYVLTILPSSKCNVTIYSKPSCQHEASGCERNRKITTSS